jgi:hypothetical protein
VRDYRKVEGPVAPGDVAPWPDLEGRAAVADPLLRDYLATVEYEWRVLADFIEERKNEDALIVVVGDHQPGQIECAESPVTFNTPFHLLSRDGALIDRFSDVGLEPGLYATPRATPQLKHEGLYSLIVSKLTDRDVYVPNGAAPSGLRR